MELVFLSSVLAFLGTRPVNSYCSSMPPGGGGGGTHGNIIGGGVPHGSSNPDPISDLKKCNFPHPFSD